MLTGFVSAAKIKYQDVEFSLNLEGVKKESGANTGDLEIDLTNLLVAIGNFARDQKTAGRSSHR